MVILLGYAVAVLAILSQPRTDRVLLNRIHDSATRFLEGKSSASRFRKQVTLSDALQCRRVQRHVAARSGAYIELSFVQAYYGLDYPVNLRRMLRPYRLYHSDIKQWEKEYSGAVQEDSSEWTDSETSCALLKILYLHHHDRRSLGTLLDMGLDGGPSEIQGEIIGNLWAKHPQALLVSCDRHPGRIEQLTLALMDNYVLESGERSPYNVSKKQFATSLRPWVHARDKRVSRAAKALRDRILHNHWYSVSSDLTSFAPSLLPCESPKPIVFPS